jgi:hypothetical protein
MNKIKHDFYIPIEEVPAFNKTYEKLTGDHPFWRAIYLHADDRVEHICTLSVSKYELLYLRLSVNGGRFVDVEARERAWVEEKRQQEQSDTTQTQMA